MSKKIEWLDNFAEKYAKEMKKTASKVEKQDLIVDRNIIKKSSKVGDLVKFKGKLYKIADLDFVDEMGPGVIISEVGTDVPTGDAMSMSMGAQVTGLEQKCTVEPERAAINPGNIYDLGDITQQEVDAANAAAQKTECDIAAENSINRTTVDGKYSNPTDSHNYVTPVTTEEVSTEEVLTEEVSIEEPVVESTEESIDEQTEEVSIDEDLCDCSEEEICEDCEDVELVATRTNRILRRIMASKLR